MGLPAAWVDEIFSRLSVIYGRDFYGRWEGLSINDVKTDWGHALSGFEQHPEAIAYALANLPQRAPTVIDFRAVCRLAPLPVVAALESPKADPARVAAEFAKLEPVRQQMRSAVGAFVDHKAWADPILARHDAGHHVNPNTLDCARVARGLPPLRRGGGVALAAPAADGVGVVL